MTIKALRKMVSDREDKRVAILAEMEKLGKEGQELEDIVARRLYKGLPGLSDAIVDVVQQNLDRAIVLDTTARRVEEKVLFGDSEAALGILQVFERDEATVGDAVKAKFSAAMEALKAATGKPARAKKGPK